MKKLTVILLLLILNLMASAQASKGTYNSLQLSIQPQDLGLGLRYDRYLTEKIGGYINVTYGNYKFEHDGYINDHCKMAIGISIRASSPTSTYLTIGISRHYYGDRYITIPFNDRVLSPGSIELGLNSCIDRFIAGFRMDPIKWEGVIDIGFKF